MYAIISLKLCIENSYLNQTMRGIKLANKFMSFCPEKAEDVWAPEGGHFNAEWAFSLGCYNGTAIYLCPFQGCHLAAYFHRPLQEILLHVGCPQAMANPGGAKVAAITAILLS